MLQMVISSTKLIKIITYVFFSLLRIITGDFIFVQIKMVIIIMSAIKMSTKTVITGELK